jgi:hypothetical protein
VYRYFGIGHDVEVWAKAGLLNFFLQEAKACCNFKRLFWVLKAKIFFFAKRSCELEKLLNQKINSHGLQAVE